MIITAATGIAPIVPHPCSSPLRLPRADHGGTIRVLHLDFSPETAPIGRARSAASRSWAQLQKDGGVVLRVFVVT
jgi:hypothetical protein